MKIFAALLFCLWASISQAQGTIILVVDTSSSMEIEHLDIQFDSYARALRELPYLENVNIEVVTFDERPRHVASGHRNVAAQAFEDLARTPPEFRGSTCLTQALYYVEAVVDTVPSPVVVDISGDGQANCAQRDDLHPTLDRLAARGVRVNTLLVSTVTYGSGDPVAAYEAMTRNGFMIHAKTYYDFEAAIFEKLTMELAQLNN